MNRIQYDFLDPQLVATNRRGEITAEQRNVLDPFKPNFISVMLITLAILSVIAGTLFIVRAKETTGMSVTIYNTALGLLAILFLVVLGVPLRNMVQMKVFDEDVSQKRIDQAEGQVRWRRGNYIVDVSGRKPYSVHADLNLMPGKYRLYYLSRSGWLLSAEQLGYANEQNALEEIVVALTQAHLYNRFSLEANREGRLTRSQRLYLTLHFIFAPLVFISGWAALALIYPTLFNTVFSSPGSFIIVAMGLLLSFWGLRDWVRLGRDIVSGEVKQEKGFVEKRTVTGDGHIAYFYRIKELEFRVLPMAYRALLPHITYRVYYTPRSKRLLTIEPVGNK